MHVNHQPEQTRHLPTALKLILAVPVAIIFLHLMFLMFAGINDPTHAVF